MNLSRDLERLRSAKGAQRRAVAELAERFHEAFRHAGSDPQKARLAEEFDLRLGRILEGRQ